MAGYENDVNNAWLAVQVFPTGRAEIFANTTFNAGTASITDFGYDAGALTGALFGLDYALHSSAMSGFSNLKIRELTQTFGLNYRMTNNLVLNTMVAFADYDDEEPWLYDSTGRYFNAFAGVSYIF
jgi:hypothetical protein